MVQLTGPALWRGPHTKEKVVALTFDDGPNDPDTLNLLGVLARHGVKATFFIVGANAAKNPGRVKQAFDEGHAIGNHSYSHAFLKPLSEPSFEKEIGKTQDVLRGIIGKTPALFRAPWFFRHPAMLRTVRRHGMLHVTGIFGNYWEVFQPSAESMAKTAERKIRPGGIVVFHDGREARGGKRHNSVEAANLLIPRLTARGYRFATLPELLGVSAYQEGQEAGFDILSV